MELFCSVLVGKELFGSVLSQEAIFIYILVVVHVSAVSSEYCYN